MFDDLRDAADELTLPLPKGKDPYLSSRSRPQPRRFLGMTRAQRLVIAVLLLMTVAVIGSLCLMVMGKVVWL